MSSGARTLLGFALIALSIWIVVAFQNKNEPTSNLLGAVFYVTFSAGILTLIDGQTRD